MGYLGAGFVADTILRPSDLFPGITHRTVLGDPLSDGDTPPCANNSPIIDAIGGIQNQANGDACTGFEFTEALGMSLVGPGYAESIVLSARDAYRGGRRWGNQLQGLGPTAPLADGGCAPSFVIAAAQADGIALASVMPYDVGALVNDQRTYAAAVDGVPRAPLVVDAFTPIVEPIGDALVRACQQAILPAGGRVSLALYASPSFQSATGAQVLTASLGGPPVNHMVGLCAYATVVSVSGTEGTLAWIDPKTQKPSAITLPFQKAPSVGDVVFLVHNSWGTGWAPLCPVRPGTAFVDTSFLNTTSFQYLVRAKLAAGTPVQRWL
jgi:hypothetical protein